MPATRDELIQMARQLRDELDDYCPYFGDHKDYPCQCGRYQSLEWRLAVAVLAEYKEETDGN